MPTPRPARPLIVMTEGSAPRPLAWLRERAEVVEAAADSPEFADRIADADGLCVRTYTRVDAALLDRAPKLKVVGRGGVGLENIAVPACRARGVEVVYTPAANTIAVGDYVICQMVRLLRPLAEFGTPASPDRPGNLPPGEFKRLRNALRGRQLNELTLGVLGMGRVGRRVGRIAASGFGMRVVYHDVADVSAHVDFPAESVDAATLYRSADVLTIHVDARPGNDGLVGSDNLSLLPAGAVVINTSRGEVLDAAALARLLQSGKLSGAALDVYSPEPPGDDFPLLGLPNVILTPHMAARTESAIENMSWVTRDVLAVVEGRLPEFPAPPTR